MSETAIVRQIEEAPLPARVAVDVGAIEAAKTAIFPKEGTDSEFRLFVAFCQRTGLDPLRKQVYAMKTQGKLAIMVGIDGMRAQAGRTGLYLGSTEPLFCGEDGQWTDVWLKKDPPAACKVGVYRRGAPKPTYATILFSEFCMPSNPNWKQRPAHMLAVRAEAHALKKAFPAELQDVQHGEPEELPLATITEEPLPTRSQPALPEPAADPPQAAAPAAPAEAQDMHALKQRVQANLKTLGHPDPKKALPYIATCLDRPVERFSQISDDAWRRLAELTTDAVQDRKACFGIWTEYLRVNEMVADNAFRYRTWGNYIDREIKSSSELTPPEWARLRAELADLEAETDATKAASAETAIPEPPPAVDPFADEA